MISKGRQATLQAQVLAHEQHSGLDILSAPNVPLEPKSVPNQLISCPKSASVMEMHEMSKENLDM